MGPYINNSKMFKGKSNFFPKSKIIQVRTIWVRRSWKMRVVGQSGGFLGSSAGKEYTCKAGSPSSIPGSGRSPGEGVTYPVFMDFPGGSDSKESTCNVGDLGLIHGSGRSSGGGHGNLLQCSCLENPHGQRSLAGYSPWGHKESDMTGRLSTA